jgi:hypothetical protein
MKKNIVWTSIIESLVIMLIVTLWVVWMYDVFSSSRKLSQATKYRIEAISIAREWIEAISNIRDTNALLFASDLENCWNVLNYNSACIWDTTELYDIDKNGLYIMFQDIDNRWKLEDRSGSITWTWYFSAWYKTNFQVRKDTRWLFTQSGGVDFYPIYTRELRFQYLDSSTSLPVSTSNTDKVRVFSRVQWTDTSSKKVYEIELTTLLTNWRKSRN